MRSPPTLIVGVFSPPLLFIIGTLFLFFLYKLFLVKIETLIYIYRRHLKIRVMIKSYWCTIRATAHAA